MAMSSSVALAGDQPQLVDQMLIQVQAEIQQGFDQLTAKLLEEIGGLRSSLESSPVVVEQSANSLISNSISPPALSSTETQQPSQEVQSHSTASEEGIKLHQHSSISPPSSISQQKSEESITHFPLHWRKTVAQQIARQCNITRSDSTKTEISNAKEKEKLIEQGCLYQFMHGSLFTIFCLFVILSNAIWMGYECDFHSASESGWQDWVSNGFNIWFIFELALKVACLRQSFLSGPDYRWNLVDAFCVLSSIPDFFSTSMNLSFLRIVRLAKLTRGLRVVRLLKFFRSLREILMTVIETMGSLFWCFVSMVFVSYIFGLLFLQLLRMHLDAGKQLSTDTMQSFQDVLSTIKTLFSLVSGGQDWYESAQDFHDHGAYLAEVVLILYVFFMLFGLVNVVIAVFCAQADEASRNQGDLRMEKDKEKEVKNTVQLIEIFRMIDAESAGFVDWEQFQTFAHSSDGQYLLGAHGLNLFAMEDLWGAMEEYTGNSGIVDVTGFIMGFKRLSEDFHSSNLLLLSRKIHSLHVDSRDMIQGLKKDLKVLANFDEFLRRHQGIQESASSMGEHQARQQSGKLRL